MKYCSNDNCKNVGKLLNINDFVVDKTKKSGLSSRCKNCRNFQKIQYSKTYNSKPEIKLRKKQYDKNRKKILKNNLNYRLKHNLRSRFQSAFKNNSKSGSIIRNLGCTIDELKIHLENHFYNNPETNIEMSWMNYGLKGWHIDHIIPLDFFTLENSEELQIACHYTNLQPMWAFENLKKQNKENL